jgi:hypothetical protein
VACGDSDDDGALLLLQLFVLLQLLQVAYCLRIVRFVRPLTKVGAIRDIFTALGKSSHAMTRAFVVCVRPSSQSSRPSCSAASLCLPLSLAPALARRGAVAINFCSSCFSPVVMPLALVLVYWGGVRGWCGGVRGWWGDGVRGWWRGGVGCANVGGVRYVVVVCGGSSQ